ncbi:MAG TPA: ABC transporter substrate-binding protein [Devosiaceae bacterium]
MLKRIPALVAVAAVAVSMAFGASAASAQSLRIGTDVDLITLEPAALTGGGQVQFWSAVYDTLLYITPDGEVKPNVASDFSYNDDKTVLTLTLRSDATYADGTPITADGVVKTMKAFIAGNGPDAKYLANVSDIAAKDGKLVLTLSAPDPALTFYLGGDAGVLYNPKAIGTDQSFDPQGSGPYILDKANSTKGSVYTFQRDEKYWNKAAYPFSTVVFTPLIDPTARLNALKSGQVDAALLTAQTQAEAQAAGASIVPQYLTVVGLQIRDLKGTKVPALGDVRVRQAMNMVFDRPSISEFLLNGLAEPTQQIFLTTSQAFVQGGDTHYPYDVDQAKKLMAEAGYADGFTITMPSTSSTALYEPVIAQSLGDINVKVEWQKVPDTQITARQLSGEFPIFFQSGSSRFAWFDINLWVGPKAQWNSFKISEPDLNAMIDRAQHAKTDADANAAYQDVGNYLIDNAWFVPFARPQGFLATKAGLSVKAQFGIPAPTIINYTASK